MKRSILCFVIAAFWGASAQAPQVEEIHIALDAPSHPFPHFWEQTFGSGRAILSLRESYRRDLRSMKQATGIQYVRFHAIFHDEVGVYDEDPQGHPIYNWSYVDQIYDGLLQNGVKPFVELSFMPRKLSSSDKVHAFWYKQFPNPPRDWIKWDDFIYNFTAHLIQRYGIEEVSRWWFEVWNEPNIDFWTGDPKQSTYLELYDHTAQAVKRVNARLRVGGPATAQAAWIALVIEHCVQSGVPLDFVSTHVYGNDSSQDVFGTKEEIPRSEMVARAVRKVYNQVKQSRRPNLPIIWSEYNATYLNEVGVTDSAFMGPYLANNIRLCDGLAASMAYWSFSDVFEEQGVVKAPFYGGYGLLAEGNVPKAAFNAFAMLHRLGETRLDSPSPNMMVTRKGGDSLAVAIWNYSEPGKNSAPRQVRLMVDQWPHAQFRSELLDPDHGSALVAWDKMGRPSYPTARQYEQLRAAARTTLHAEGNSITLPSQGLALVEVSAQ